MDGTMSDKETHQQVGQRRGRDRYDLIVRSEVHGDPSNIVLMSPDGRLSPPSLSDSLDLTEEGETDTEERYVPQPERAGAPPSPASERWRDRSTAISGQKSHSEKHLERRPLSAKSPKKAPMPNVEKIP